MPTTDEQRIDLWKRRLHDYLPYNNEEGKPKPSIGVLIVKGGEHKQCRFFCVNRETHRVVDVSGAMARLLDLKWNNKTGAVRMPNCGYAIRHYIGEALETVLGYPKGSIEGYDL